MLVFVLHMNSSMSTRRGCSVFHVCFTIAGSREIHLKCGLRLRELRQSQLQPRALVGHESLCCRFIKPTAVAQKVHRGHRVKSNQRLSVHQFVRHISGYDADIL
jgi:hypothetical protein